MTETAGQLPLWGDDDPTRFAPNPTETAVIAAINSMNEQTPLDPVRTALAMVCRSLARNIDGGNVKGRAIANEATQLAALLKQLAGIEEGTDPTNPDGGGLIPQQTQDFINALATPPRLDTPSASYAP